MDSGTSPACRGSKTQKGRAARIFPPTPRSGAAARLRPPVAMPPSDEAPSSATASSALSRSRRCAQEPTHPAAALYLPRRINWKALSTTAVLPTALCNSMAHSDQAPLRGAPLWVAQCAAQEELRKEQLGMAELRSETVACLCMLRI